MRRLLPLAVALSGCIAEEPQYVYGTDLDTLELVLTGPTMGVHPDTSVLTVKENPFVAGAGEVRWTTLGEGMYVASFYAWASGLAYIPEGERQYYTAFNAHQIYALQRAEPEDLVWVREIAIGGYQSMLDNFPDAITYDATGTYFWRLAPLAYQGIVDLGGTPEGGWIEVPTEDGGIDVVQP